MLTLSSPASAPPPRDRILQTAHELFYRDGIRATGIDRVIAESGVTKVTFYRHFPSKNDLVLAYLEYRHRLWMDWFREALRRHGGQLPALPRALGEWFRAPVFRGCAFINSVGEVGSTQPQVRAIARRHKQDMADAIAEILPPSRRRRQDARTIAIAVDGAIVRAQTDASPEGALRGLGRLLQALVAADAAGAARTQ
jgi:AcrR family transcriptional regulator